jgi:hypothetical protein
MTGINHGKSQIPAMEDDQGRQMDAVVPWFVYAFHFIGLCVCLYSPTEVHRGLFIDFSLRSLLLPVYCFLAVQFYYLTRCGPGFADDEGSCILEGARFTSHCDACNLTPPLRASHCNRCRHCVLRRDHHCLWVGECVGMENHLFFVLYLFFETLCLRRLFVEALPVAQLDSGVVVWFFTSFLSAVIVAVSSFGLFQTIILFPLHVVMMCLNRTTWETITSRAIPYLKDWPLRFSPFSKGLIGNISEFVTMRYNHPKYHIPTGEAMHTWKAANSFLVNDKYECC